MKLNFKIRFQNKVWLTSFLCFLAGVIINGAPYFGVNLPVTLEDAKEAINCFIGFMCFVGILQDGTTPGFFDSDRAMTYGTAEDVRIND